MRNRVFLCAKFVFMVVIISLYYTNLSAHDLNQICQIEKQCVHRGSDIVYIYNDSIFRALPGGYIEALRFDSKPKSLYLYRNKFIIVLTKTSDLYIRAPDERGTEMFWVKIGRNVNSVNADSENLIAVYNGFWRFSKPTIVWFNLKEDQIKHRAPGQMEYECGLNSFCQFGSVMAGTYKETFPFENLEIVNFEKIYKEDNQIFVQFRGNVTLPFSIILSNLKKYRSR